MELEKLKKLQNYIRDNGIENDPNVSDIMKINISKYGEEYEYYKSIAGKYFLWVPACCHKNSILFWNVTAFYASTDYQKDSGRKSKMNYILTLF